KGGLMNRIAARSLLALALALSLAGSACAGKKEPFGRLTVDEVEGLVRKGKAHVFDNNPREVWAQAHVPGAKWVKYNEIRATDLPTEKDATLVFYCANES